MKPMKTDPTTPQCANDARGIRVGIVSSQYHGEICAALTRGATDAFVAARGDADSIVHAPAPGAFELVAVGLALAERPDIDAVVAIGCVLTGETSHDRYLCDAVSHGLTEISLRTGKPVAFGVLTCTTIEQARARAGGSKGNKGIEAMHAAIAATRAIQEIRAASTASIGGNR